MTFKLLHYNLDSRIRTSRISCTFPTSFISSTNLSTSVAASVLESAFSSHEAKASHHAITILAIVGTKVDESG